MNAKSDLNILLITADQFRADCLSVVGHPCVRTPNIDALAADGMLFTRHFGQCPPCGPSRTSLLTGMYQMNHRSVQNGTPLDAGLTNLAKEVRRASVEPWLIGYTDTTMDPRTMDRADPRLKRYEEILPGMLQFAPGSEWGEGDTDWRHHLRRLGYDIADNPFQQRPDWPHAAERGPTFAPTFYKAEHSDTAYTADRAIRFIGQMTGAPWFLHVSFLRPHPPFVAPEPWNDMYSLEEVPDFVALPSLEDERAVHPFLDYRLDHLEMDPKLPIGTPPNENIPWRQARATYYGLISELDFNLGRVMAALKESGDYERTLIVFTSDHGEMLGDHWVWGKEVPYDAATHVPLVVRSPRTPVSARGRTVTKFTEHIDLMPTILDHLGLDVPLQCDGRSLNGFLEGGAPDRWRSSARWEYDFRNIYDPSVEGRFGLSIDECSMSILRTETGKYVHFAGLDALYFDLEEDPGELKNRIADPSYMRQVLEHAGQMLDWRLAFNRREMTGIAIRTRGFAEADRSRRIT